MAEVIELKVPALGDFETVEIIDVMVAAGDVIAVDDPLITLETDKAAMDVPSTAAGTVKELKVKTGDQVSEGSVILLLEPSGEVAVHSTAPTEKHQAEAKAVLRTATKVSDGDEDVGAVLRTATKVSDGDEDVGAVLRTATVTAAGKSGAPAHASPSVRKFARELGVDLSQVTGSGRKGRITQEDVKAHVKGVMRGGAAPSTGGFALPAMPAVDFSRWGEVSTEPLSRIKRLSGPHLQRAWMTIPHVTQHDEADITDLEALRKVLKRDAEKVGAKLTPLAFIAKACVHALKAFPDFNASLDATGQNLVRKHYFHIGFAVDTPEGLVVPVVRDVDAKSVFDIATELGELSQRARDRKLKAEDMQGGSFSISSLGGIGGIAFTPIINAPEVAILGVSRAAMKPVWDGTKFEPRLTLPLSLSYDHRVIDGAAAARFTSYLAEVLEEVRNLVL